MFHLYGFFTQNTRKVLYVLSELGADFEFHFVDLGKGEQRSDDFRAKTPVGKVPLLVHDGHSLFESGAICRYVANVEDFPVREAFIQETAAIANNRADHSMIFGTVRGSCITADSVRVCPKTLNT